MQDWDAIDLLRESSNSIAQSSVIELTKMVITVERKRGVRARERSTAVRFT